MGFIKIPKQRSSLDVPALHINKSMSFLNRAFCEKYDLKEMGDTLRLDVLYDSDKDVFAIDVNEQGEHNCKVNKSRQLQIYLFSAFKKVGKTKVATGIVRLKHMKKSGYWTFEAPKAKEGEQSVDSKRLGGSSNKRKRKHGKTKTK